MNPPLTKRPQHIVATNRQRGVTSLFVTLIVLLVVMLLGVTAAMMSSTQFMLSGNLQRENDAFNSSEAAAATAQNWLKTNYANAGFTTYNASTTPYLFPSTWPTDTSGVPCATTTPCAPSGGTPLTWSDSDSLAVNSSTRYVIQKIAQNVKLPGDVEICDSNPLNLQRADMFRISALGTGPKGTSKLVQTTYTVPTPPQFLQC